MGAALLLRLTEARRRGGLWLLGGGALLVAWIARTGGATVDGRYGLATDLAAVLTYVAAIFFGAFPLALDRERRRSYLPSASPVAPWTWALGNGLGAAAVGLIAGVVLFGAAGAGAALGGGIRTHAVAPIGDRGTVRLPIVVAVPEEARLLRIATVSYLRGEEVHGALGVARIAVGADEYDVHPNLPLVVPLRATRVEIRNVNEAYTVGLVTREVRALLEERSFLLNALAAGLAPALGAAALAAVGAAAAAHLSAPVAALLTALILLLASMKGFLLETFEFRGRAQHAHAGRDGPVDAQTRAAAQAGVRALLATLPNLAALDHTGKVAVGEWTGTGGAARALAALAAALLVAAAIGGAGVYARRLP